MKKSIRKSIIVVATPKKMEDLRTYSAIVPVAHVIPPNHSFKFGDCIFLRPPAPAVILFLGAVKKSKKPYFRKKLIPTKPHSTLNWNWYKLWENAKESVGTAIVK